MTVPHLVSQARWHAIFDQQIGDVVVSVPGRVVERRETLLRAGTG